jgi:hypothetical protein
MLKIHSCFVKPKFDKNKILENAKKKCIQNKQLLEECIKYYPEQSY